jgi:hypothetical protein
VRLLKSPSSKAAVDESTGGVFFSPAHPKLPRQLVLREGYVEDTFKAKMPLAGFFNSLSVD